MSNGATTQKDRELLAKAARAIHMMMGSEVGQWTAFPEGVDGYVRRNANGTTTVWNPLRDDGDVLRLANRTGTCIEFGYCSDDAPIVRCGRIEERDNWPQVGNFPDPNAATRRAVVEAVAADQDALDAALAGLEEAEAPAGASAAADVQPYIESIDRSMLQRAARTGHAAALDALSRAAGTPLAEWARKDMRILIDHLREDTHFDASLIEQMLAFAQRGATSLVELQDEVAHVRSWYEPRMDMLGAWARAHLDRAQQETFFNIWANCSPSADGIEPEWLRAHRAARTEGPHAMAPVQPDAWQMRRYYTGDDAGWGLWKECSAEEAEKWKGRNDIQVRPLYVIAPLAAEGGRNS